LWVNRRSGASGIEKDIEGTDQAPLEMRDIRAGDDNRAIARAGAPLQAPDTVVTDSRTRRAEDKVRRQVG
jgi:hypothetical protein